MLARVRTHTLFTCQREKEGVRKRGRERKREGEREREREGDRG